MDRELPSQTQYGGMPSIMEEHHNSHYYNDRGLQQLDQHNRDLFSELNHAEKIRDINVYRLGKMQNLTGKGDDLANLRLGDTLQGYDNDLFNLITPYPNNKSSELISAGESIMGSNKYRSSNEIE